MEKKINGVEAITDADLENVIGGIRQSNRVRVKGIKDVTAEEDLLAGGRLICPNCGNPVSKTGICNSPLCINLNNISKA